MNFRDISILCFNFFFPHRCFSCKQIVQDNGGLCNICWLKINFIQKPCCTKCSRKLLYDIGSYALCAECISGEFVFDNLFFVMTFNEISKSLIHSFKFYDQLYLSKFFAKLIYSYWQDKFKDVDFIIPVPMHKKRLMIRKFNQAALLAKNLAILANKENILDGIIKHKKTLQQANLNKNQRKVNIKNSFTINSKKLKLIKDKNVLLIDDVLTTGATVNECAKVLKLAGVAKVKVATIARVL